MKEMPRVEVARHVNEITNCKLNEAEWRINKEPYSQANPPPVLSARSVCSFLNIPCPSDLTNRLSWHRFAGQGAPPPGHEWMSDREDSDVDGPELGADTMEEGGDKEVARGGGGGDGGPKVGGSVGGDGGSGGPGAGGSAGGGGEGIGNVQAWPNDDEGDEERHLPRGGAGTGARSPTP